MDDFIAHLLDVIKRRKEATNCIRQKNDLKDPDVQTYIENYSTRYEILKVQLGDIIDLQQFQPNDVQIFGIKNGAVNEIAFGEIFLELVKGHASNVLDYNRFLR